MADDKKLVGARDRAKVAAGEDYELEHFARQHGMTLAEVRDLIARVGNDRAALERAAGQKRA